MLVVENVEQVEHLGSNDFIVNVEADDDLIFTAVFSDGSMLIL